MVPTFFGFVAFTLGCALAPNWPALVVFRFLTGVCAAVPITVVAGIYADLYDDPVRRGRAMAVFMAVGRRIEFVCLALIVLVQYLWSHHGTVDCGLCVFAVLEVAVLDRFADRGGLVLIADAAARDVCTCYLEETS